jgi:hypothetical protein
VPGRERVDGRTHVQEQRFDRIRVGIADGGDDLLVDVAGERIKRPPGWVFAFEERRLLKLDVVADDADAPRRGLRGDLCERERLARLAAGDVVGRGLGHATLPVIVTDQQV